MCIGGVVKNAMHYKNKSERNTISREIIYACVITKLYTFSFFMYIPCLCIDTFPFIVVDRCKNKFWDITCVSFCWCIKIFSLYKKVLLVFTKQVFGFISKCELLTFIVDTFAAISPPICRWSLKKE